MKIFARIATAAVAVFASLFIAAPALASEGGEKHNPADVFSSAGQPVDVAATLITGAIVLAVVLILAQSVSSLFEKSGE